MNLGGLLFVLIAHYLCGAGALKLFRMQERTLQSMCLSFIVGVFIVSFVPCLLQLLHITIVETSVAIGVALIAAVFCIPFLLKFKKPSIQLPGLIALYEWPFIIAIVLLALVSVWRCFYYPPTSRDMLTGPELVAEYTVREGTMVNSVYSIDLSTTNNYFKSPFITGLQIVYKLLVCQFGQIWLSILFISFTIWIYSLLRRQIHPLPAGFLALIFIATPTLYGYTYIMLYDYSNTIFFLLGYYFFIRESETKERRDFMFACFLFGIATYIRTETLVFIFMLLPLLIFFISKSKLTAGQIAARSALFIMIPTAGYFICMNIFMQNFVPIHFDFNGQFNTDFRNVSIFFQRLADIAQMVFSKNGITIYGFITLLFVAVLLVDIFWIRKFSREAIMVLYGILAIFIGYAMLGYLFPLVVDIANTTKRGLFKAVALMVLYFCVSGFIRRVSDWIQQIETDRRYPAGKIIKKKCSLNSADIVRCRDFTPALSSF